EVFDVLFEVAARDVLHHEVVECFAPRPGPGGFTRVDGQADEATLRAIAPVLDLDPNALVDLAQGQWKPEKLEDFEGLAQFNTSYGGMLVNAYLVWDPATKHAAAFDTGADCAGMLKLTTKENLSISLILLTHA